MSDYNPIDRPSHYAEGRKYEPIDVIADWELNYRLGNVCKYISRAGRKNCAIEDLKKAAFYLNREIESLEAAKSPYAVTYEDVLEDYAACASDGYDVRRSLDDQHDLWDDSLGPLEPPQNDYLGDAEWDAAYAVAKQYEREAVEAKAAMMGQFCDFDIDELHKDLDQFENNEVIRTFERRGLIFGVDKQGRTYVLGAGGISK